MGSTERLFLIDTDAGLDDAQALMMAVSHPGVKVVGITTTHGNATVKQVGRNVLRILRVVQKQDVSRNVSKTNVRLYILNLK